MELKVYSDRLSQPSRAVLIFCKANGIEFEEVTIELTKAKHTSPEYAEVNPLKQVPAIVHGDFKLSESHAILIYLASVFGVADHWYPADVRQRAKVQSVLDWHHSNLRRGSVAFLLNTIILQALGLPGDPKAAADGEKLLVCSLAAIESNWLQGDGPFLLGNSNPSIADLALACEVTQLELADEEDRERILGPHKKILKWIEDVKSATAPHFEEIHTQPISIRDNLMQVRKSD